jgi:hypothetical protein
VKRAAFALTIAAACAAPHVAASDCEKTEFAELQAKTKKGLELYYCDMKAKAEALDVEFERFIEAAKRTGARVDRSKGDALIEVSLRCSKESIRAFEILANKHKAKTPPACPA